MLLASLASFNASRGLRVGLFVLWFTRTTQPTNKTPDKKGKLNLAQPKWRIVLAFDIHM